MTLRDWVQRGYVRVIDLGTRKYITLQEYERWLAEGAYKPEGGSNEPSSSHIPARPAQPPQQMQQDFGDGGRPVFDEDY
jgi:hypothetical protein